MICGVQTGRRATKANLMSGCARFGLSIDEASAIVDRMRTIVASGWEVAVRQNGASLADCVSNRPAFDVPGFDD